VLSPTPVLSVGNIKQHSHEILSHDFFQVISQSRFLGSLGISFRVEALLQKCAEEQAETLRTGRPRSGNAPEDQTPVGMAMGSRYMVMAHGHCQQKAAHGRSVSDSVRTRAGMALLSLWHPPSDNKYDHINVDLSRDFGDQLEEEKKERRKTAPMPGKKRYATSFCEVLRSK
jgi:hypothetical protein